MAALVHCWDSPHSATYEFRLEPGIYHASRGARVEQYLPHDGPAGTRQYHLNGTWLTEDDPVRMVWKPVVGDGGRFTVEAPGRFRLMHGGGHAGITRE